mgnify:CR=1 FL=1
MPRIVDWRHVLAVRDLAASTRYYTDVLGFEHCGTLAIPVADGEIAQVAE